MKPVILISERDNVATALDVLEAGRQFDLRGARITVTEAIPRGHKVAVAPIGAGQPVVKYGSPIGLATADVRPGAHVHTHNLASSRGRGDLDAPATPAPRLAEPPDESVHETAGPGAAAP
jgi:hypothetical protein